MKTFVWSLIILMLVCGVLICVFPGGIGFFAFVILSLVVKALGIASHFLILSALVAPALWVAVRVIRSASR